MGSISESRDRTVDYMKRFHKQSKAKPIRGWADKYLMNGDFVDQEYRSFQLPATVEEEYWYEFWTEGFIFLLLKNARRRRVKNSILRKQKNL